MEIKGATVRCVEKGEWNWDKWPETSRQVECPCGDFREPRECWWDGTNMTFATRPSHRQTSDSLLWNGLRLCRVGNFSGYKSYSTVNYGTRVRSYSPCCMFSMISAMIPSHCLTYVGAYGMCICVLYDGI